MQVYVINIFLFHYFFFSDFRKETAMITYRTYNKIILENMVSHFFTRENTAIDKTEMFYSNENQN